MERNKKKEGLDAFLKREDPKIEALKQKYFEESDKAFKQGQETDAEKKRLL